jgi:hypothetical protein
VKTDGTVRRGSGGLSITGVGREWETKTDSAQRALSTGRLAIIKARVG